jgi:hypothetical protein
MVPQLADQGKRFEDARTANAVKRPNREHVCSIGSDSVERAAADFACGLAIPSRKLQRRLSHYLPPLANGSVP